MTENWIEETTEGRSEVFTASVAPRDVAAAQTPSRRFTVSGFKRVPQKYFPTLVVGASVVVAVTIMLVINVLGK